jgi:hypothetical protein
MSSANRAAIDVGGDLVEFIVAPEYKNELLKGLASFGIRYDTLFPDLDGLSREFNRSLRPILTVRSGGIPLDEDTTEPPD